MRPQPKRHIRANSPENRLGPLLSVGWLAEQSEAFKAWACEVGQLRHFAEGQYIYVASDAPDGVYGLRSGALEVELPLVADEPVALLRTTVGFWIGDSGLLSQRQRMVSVMAVEESTFIWLPGREVRALLAETPAHWQAFYDLSHRNTELAVSLLAESLSLTVLARVCRRLLHLSENRVEAHTTQDSLAKTLGVARPTLRRSLNALVDLGAIELRYRRVAIVDRTVLHRFKNEQ